MIDGWSPSPSPSDDGIPSIEIPSGLDDLACLANLTVMMMLFVNALHVTRRLHLCIGPSLDVQEEGPSAVSGGPTRRAQKKD